MSRHPEPRRPAKIVAMSRPGGEARLLAELDVADARAYRRAVAALTPRIEFSLGPGVLANRARGRGALATTRSEPWIPAWDRWRRSLRSAARSGSWLVRADVASFYGSVREPALRTALAGDAERVLDVLRSLWEDGVAGLPIGPEPSAILANAVLAPADEAILRAGGAPIRWVDDWVIRVPDRRAAEEVLLALGATLRDVGLVLNPVKTEMVPPGQARAVVRGRGSGGLGSGRAMMPAP